MPPRPGRRKSVQSVQKCQNTIDFIGLFIILYTPSRIAGRLERFIRLPLKREASLIFDTLVMQSLLAILKTFSPLDVLVRTKETPLEESKSGKNVVTPQ